MSTLETEINSIADLNKKLAKIQTSDAYKNSINATFDPGDPPQNTTGLKSVISQLSKCKKSLDDLSLKIKNQEIKAISSNTDLTKLMEEYKKTISLYETLETQIHEAIERKIEHAPSSKEQYEFVESIALNNTKNFNGYFSNMPQVNKDMKSRPKDELPPYMTAKSLNQICNSRELDDLFGIGILRRKAGYSSILDESIASNLDNIQRVIIKSYSNLDQTVAKNEIAKNTDPFNNAFKAILAGYKKNSEPDNKVYKYFTDQLRSKLVDVENTDLINDFDKYISTKGKEYKLAIFNNQLTEKKLDEVLKEFHEYNKIPTHLKDFNKHFSALLESSLELIEERENKAKQHQSEEDDDISIKDDEDESDVDDEDIIIENPSISLFNEVMEKLASIAQNERDLNNINDFKEFIAAKGEAYKLSVFNPITVKEKRQEILNAYHEYLAQKVKQDKIFLAGKITLESLQRYEENLDNKLKVLTAEKNQLFNGIDIDDVKSRYAIQVQPKVDEVQRLQAIKKQFVDALDGANRLQKKINELENNLKTELDKSRPKYSNPEKQTKFIQDMRNEIQSSREELGAANKIVDDIKKARGSSETPSEKLLDSLNEKIQKLNSEIDKTLQAQWQKINSYEEDFTQRRNQIIQEKQLLQQAKAQLEQDLIIQKGIGKLNRLLMTNTVTGLKSEFNKSISVENTSSRSIRASTIIDSKQGGAKKPLDTELFDLIKQSDVFADFELRLQHYEATINDREITSALAYVSPQERNAFDNMQKELVELRKQYNVAMSSNEDKIKLALKNATADEQFQVLCKLSYLNSSQLSKAFSMMSKVSAEIMHANDKLPEYVTPQKLNTLLTNDSLDQEIIKLIKSKPNEFSERLKDTKAIKIDNIQRVLMKTYVGLSSENEKMAFYKQFKNCFTPEFLSNYQAKIMQQDNLLKQQTSQLSQEDYQKQKAALDQEKSQFQSLKMQSLLTHLQTLQAEFLALGISKNEAEIMKLYNDSGKLSAFSVQMNDFNKLLENTKSDLEKLGLKKSDEFAKILDEFKKLDIDHKTLIVSTNEKINSTSIGSGEEQFRTLCMLAISNPTQLLARFDSMQKWQEDMKKSNDQLPKYMSQKLNNLLASSLIDDKIIAQIKNKPVAFLNALSTYEGKKIDNVERVLMKTLMSFDNENDKIAFYDKFKKYITVEAVERANKKIDTQLEDLRSKLNSMPKELYNKEKMQLEREKEQLNIISNEIQTLNKMIDSPRNRRSTIFETIKGVNIFTSSKPKSERKDSFTPPNSLPPTPTSTSDLRKSSSGSEGSSQRLRSDSSSESISQVAHKNQSTGWVSHKPKALMRDPLTGECRKNSYAPPVTIQSSPNTLISTGTVSPQVDTSPKTPSPPSTPSPRSRQ